MFLGGGPAGIEAIAHTMSTAVDTLEDDVEPFLLRYELIVRTPRGRRLTERGEAHLGDAPPSGPPAEIVLKVSSALGLSERFLTDITRERRFLEVVNKPSSGSFIGKK